MFLVGLKEKWNNMIFDLISRLYPTYHSDTNVHLMDDNIDTRPFVCLCKLLTMEIKMVRLLFMFNHLFIPPLHTMRTGTWCIWKKPPRRCSKQLRGQTHSPTTFPNVLASFPPVCYKRLDRGVDSGLWFNITSLNYKYPLFVKLCFIHNI